jgi:hypothetical protein
MNTTHLALALIVFGAVLVGLVLTFVLIKDEFRFINGHSEVRHWKFGKWSRVIDHKDEK